jgi:hypothetical protein
MEYPGSWGKNLLWAKFLYNNSYQESLKMASFEALNGRQCRTPLNWIEEGEKAIFGLDIADEAEATVCHIQDNLKPQSHTKRAMQTRGADLYSLRLETTYT